MTKAERSGEADKELWLRARDGDRAALDAVLRAHETQIYRFGLRLCGNEDAAREVLQRTMLAAFENLSSFRGDARPSTWLYALARSACSRLHRRTRSAPVHDVPMDDAAPSLASDTRPDDDLQRAQMADLVATAIGMLPPDAREVVVLRDVEGLPAEEAAGILGLQIPALKSRLHRARAQLRMHLITLMRDSGPSVGAARACPVLAGELEALGNRDLDQAACRSIESHVHACEACRGNVGGLEEAVSLCRRIPGDAVPDAVQRAVRAALREVLPAAATESHDAE